MTLSLSHRSRKPYRASTLLELTNVAQISGQCPGNWLVWLARKGVGFRSEQDCRGRNGTCTHAKVCVPAIERHSSSPARMAEVTSANRMSENPTVSVIVPAFNAAQTIARALDSALNQTTPADEIIVVDDSSADATRDIVCRYAARGVRLIDSPVRGGAARARNAGIASASGDLVAFLDSDDEWLPTKLEKQVSLIQTDAAFSFVACGSNLISPSGADMGDLYHGRPVATGAAAWKALLACNFIATPAVVVWRRVLASVGGFDETMKVGEDQDLWIRLALAGSLGYVRESLVRVHGRENSLSSWMLNDFLTYTFPMVERHIAALGQRLTPRDIRQIRGERFGRCGRVAYAKGQFGDGISLLGRSILLGYEPLESARHIAVASPPAKWLKQQLGFRTAS